MLISRGIIPGKSCSRTTFFISFQLKGSRLEAEVDRCRTECNWKRLGELLSAVRQKHGGLDEKVADVLEAEYIIETFVEKRSGFIEPKKENELELQRAKTLLMKAAESSLSSHPTHNLELNLLLAKLNYYWYSIAIADFENVLNNIDTSKLEVEKMSFPTLPSLRLAAEAYAVKGFSIEATLGNLDKSQQKIAKMRALFYFENSAYMTLEYIKGRDSQLNSSARSSTGTLLSLQPTNSNSGCKGSERIGDLLESSLERLPVLKMRQSFCDQSSGTTGIKWYRYIIASLWNKSVGEKLQQRLGFNDIFRVICRLSRQLAEVLLQKAPDYSNTKLLEGKLLSNDVEGSRFRPESRIEEVLLLLLISELIPPVPNSVAFNYVLASRDVVLSRAEELAISRNQSLQNAKAVYNLLTLVLSTLRQYELLGSIYERGMKFVNEDRYIWFLFAPFFPFFVVIKNDRLVIFGFQFALTLMCHGRWVRASRILQQCMAIERRDENALVEHMHAARVEIEYLGQFDEAIYHAEEAIKLSENNWLNGRCHLLRALAFSLKADHEVQYKIRKEMYAEAIKQFEEAINLDPHDALAHYYCAKQYAIARDLRHAREQCDRALELNGEMSCALMLLALISTANKDYEGALEFVSEALLNFPTNFGLLVLRLKLEIKLGLVKDAVETSKELLYFWRSSEINCFSENFPFHYSEKGGKLNTHENRSVTRSLSSRDAFVPVLPILTAPMGIGAPAPTSFLGGDQDAGSTCGGGLAVPSEAGGATSTFSDGLNSRSSIGSQVFTRFRNQEYFYEITIANIWVELAELFIESGQLEIVRTCVEEACSIFPNSHQTLYLKGKLLTLRAAKETDEKIIAHLHNEAKVCLLGALALVPSHVTSLKHLANIYYSEGNVLMAEKMLKDILQIDPLYSDSWQLLGIVLSKAGRYDEALECLRTASKLDNSTPLFPFSFIPITFDS
uniref:TTC7_N domain-containing protein n=1 Tax=Syphacia muris TaxID=451379 RepID=A0A0N5AL77_9BILA